MMSRRNSTLASAVAESLEHNLREGLYGCGDRLVESVIAQEMNVSQNTVRDALNMLERDGWVTRHARRGVVVRQFNAGEAVELYILRFTLEKLALAWAMATITEAEKALLARIIAGARLDLNADNDRGARAALFSFHYTLLKLSQKPQTIHLLTTLLNQCVLLSNLKALHDPHSHPAYTQMITRYGDLMTHIRYDQVDQAQVHLESLLETERRDLLPVLDLVT